MCQVRRSQAPVWVQVRGSPTFGTSWKAHLHPTPPASPTSTTLQSIPSGTPTQDCLDLCSCVKKELWRRMESWFVIHTFLTENLDIQDVVSCDNAWTLDLLFQSWCQNKHFHCVQSTPPHCFVCVLFNRGVLAESCSCLSSPWMKMRAGIWGRTSSGLAAERQMNMMRASWKAIRCTVISLITFELAAASYLDSQSVSPSSDLSFSFSC